MTSKDLMINCWVTGKKWREKPFKITRINDSGKYYCGITAEGSKVGPFLVEELDPIPITAEILEKNFPEPTDGLTWFPEEGGFNCHTYVPKCEINAFGLFKYVHELQHALRLCGIEKEIVLHE